MLSDIEMKVLRIIMNYWRSKGRSPRIRELEKKTGRSNYGITEVLHVLKSEKLIKWDMQDPNRILVDEHKCAQRGF